MEIGIREYSFRISRQMVLCWKITVIDEILPLPFKLPGRRIIVIKIRWKMSKQCHTRIIQPHMEEEYVLITPDDVSDTAILINNTIAG